MRLHSSSSSVTALLAVPTTACLLATGRCRAQGVSGSCTLAGAIFAQDKYLGAYCTNDKKEIHGYDWTWINLDWCIRNDQGVLKFADNGRFSGSCSRCEFDLKSSRGSFSCRCVDGSGKLRERSAVQLDSQLWNINGTMGCYGHCGNKTRAGPQCKSCTQ